MVIGKVKWFNNEKKYGFILADDREFFVHFSAILKEGYKTLKKGQDVEFDVVQGPKGEMAANVKVLPSVKFHGRSKQGNSRRFFMNPPFNN